MSFAAESPPTPGTPAALPEPHYASQARRLVHETVAASAANILIRFASAAMMVVLAWVMTKEQFGQAALILSVVAMTNDLTMFGLPSAVNQLVSRYFESDRALAAGYYWYSRRLYLGITAVGTLALVALAGPLAAALGHPEMTLLLRACGATFFLVSLRSFYNVVAMAAQQYRSRVFRIMVPSELLRIAATLGLVALAGFGVWGVILGQFTGWLFAVVLSIPLIEAQFRGAVKPPERRAVLSIVVAVSPATIAYTAAGYMDTLVVTRFAGLGALAAYQISMSFILLLATSVPIGALMLSTLNRLAVEDAARLLRRAVHLALFAAPPLAMGVSIVAAQAVVWLYGARYAEVQLVLPAVSLLLFERLMTPTMSNALTVAGRAWLGSIGAVASVMLILVGSATLGPRYGLGGIIAAVVAARYLAILWFAWNLRDRGTAVSAAQAGRYALLLATTLPVVAAVLLDAGPASRLGALALSLAAYLGAASLLRLIPAEARALLRAVAARRPLASMRLARG